MEDQQETRAGSVQDYFSLCLLYQTLSSPSGSVRIFSPSSVQGYCRFTLPHHAKRPAGRPSLPCQATPPPPLHACPGLGLPLATHRLGVHRHVTLAEKLQVLAVGDIAKPHADPEVSWEHILLSFTLWVLSQRPIGPIGALNTLNTTPATPQVGCTCPFPPSPGSGALTELSAGAVSEWHRVLFCPPEQGGSTLAAMKQRGWECLAEGVAGTLIMGLTDIPCEFVMGRHCASCPVCVVGLDPHSPPRGGHGDCQAHSTEQHTESWAWSGVGLGPHRARIHVSGALAGCKGLWWAWKELCTLVERAKGRCSWGQGKPRVSSLLGVWARENGCRHRGQGPGHKAAPSPGGSGEPGSL